MLSHKRAGISAVFQLSPVFGVSHETVKVTSCSITSDSSIETGSRSRAGRLMLNTSTWMGQVDAQYFHLDVRLTTGSKTRRAGRLMWCGRLMWWVVCHSATQLQHLVMMMSRQCV